MAATPTATKSSPRDALVMSSILKDMGVQEHEPRLINQMLEFTYRYVTDVLDDAKVYSTHASKKAIDTEDVKLAVRCCMDHSFTLPPPRDLLMEIARHKNSQALPLIKPYSGPRLPPDRYCLASTNYRLAHQKKKTHRIQIGLPVNQFSAGGQRISFTPVQSKTTGKLAGGNIIPSMSIINRGNTSAGQKPLVRVSSGLLSVRNAGSNNSMPETSVNMVPGVMTIDKTSSSLIPGLVPNPLKRKHEDDDYDQT